MLLNKTIFSDSAIFIEKHTVENWAWAKSEFLCAKKMHHLARQGRLALGRPGCVLDGTSQAAYESDGPSSYPTSARLGRCPAPPAAPAQGSISLGVLPSAPALQAIAACYAAYAH